MNFDTGVIPVSILEIKKEMGLNYTEIALLGSMSYLGITVVCLGVPYLFWKYPARLVLSVAMLVNVVSCVLFALSY